MYIYISILYILFLKIYIYIVRSFLIYIKSGI